MSTRKEKVAKAKLNREERKFQRQMTNSAQIISDTTREIEDLDYHLGNRDKYKIDDRSAVLNSGENIPKIRKVFDPKDHWINKPLSSTRVPEAKNNVAQATVETPTVTTPAVTDDVAKSPVATPAVKTAMVADQGITQSTQTTPVVGSEIPTISSLVAPRLNELKTKAETEKTDAQKMQKYYALTDALKSLGKMGGAAIGGAIGGDVIGGAPTVGEYKESRGYLDAFEKAKQANDRLRSLDETEFKLAVEDAERSYNQQLAKIERDFKAEQAQIEREWQQYMVDYKSKIEQAYKVGNMALAHQYEMELAQKQGEIRDRQIAAQNKADMAEKQISLQIAQLQNDPNKKKTPIKFNDGTSVAIPDWLYEGLKENLIGSTVNGKTVKESNVTQIIKDNPELAKEFLSGFGFELSSQKSGETKVDDNWAASVVGKDKVTFPLHISQVPVENMKASQAQAAYSIETDPFAEFLE